MKYSGLKTGFVFFTLSIIITLTFVGPVFILFISEGIGTSINTLIKAGNVSGTTFYTSIAFCLLTLGIYIFTFIRHRPSSIGTLTLFFATLFIFLNAALFYYKIRLPNSHIDGQQAFDIIDKPIRTCILYLLFGLGHDIANYRFKKNSDISSRDIAQEINSKEI